MHVRLPGGRQRDFQTVGNQSPQHADVARPRDLYEIRPELTNLRFQLAVMSPEKQVVVVGPVDGEFQAAAAQFDVCDRPIRIHLVPRARVHHEQGHSAAPGKGFKLLAGVGYPVHLVIHAREKGDPWILPAHEAVSGEISEGA